MTFNVSDDLIPKEFEATGEFRRPKKGEYYLVYDDSNFPKATQAVFDFDSTLVLILRKKRELKQIIFTVAGPARALNPGEYYFLSGPESIVFLNGPTTHTDPRIPLTCTKIWE